MIKLPYPPSINKMYTNRKQDGRRLLTKEARQWKNDANLILSNFKIRKKFKSNTEIIFSMWIIPPDNRKRDSSNVLKIVEDAFVEAKWIEDDRYNITHHIHKCEPQKEPFIIVELNELKDICQYCEGTGINIG